MKGCINPHGMDSKREIMQLVVSAQQSLHFIFLIEPPAAPTSRAGPAYQDLKADGSGRFETRISQDWPIRVQTQVPEAKGGWRDLLFPFTCVPVTQPSSSQATGN